MLDRVINSAWRFVIIGLIFALGSAGMFLLYQGLLDLLTLRWQTSAGPLLTAMALGVGVYWLARHRNDLIYG